jgi:hypothetical protein
MKDIYYLNQTISRQIFGNLNGVGGCAFAEKIYYFVLPAKVNTIGLFGVFNSTTTTLL